MLISCGVADKPAAGTETNAETAGTGADGNVNSDGTNGDIMNSDGKDGSANVGGTNGSSNDTGTSDGKTVATGENDGANESGEGLPETLKDVTDTIPEHPLEWVEYGNSDGTYTKGSDIIEEEKKMDSLMESDIEDLPIVSAEDVAAYQGRSEGLYYYRHLNDTEKYLYGEIYGILDRMLDAVKVSTLDADLLGRVFLYVLYDHPEIFYVSGYNYIRYTVGDELKAIVLSGKYIFTPEERVEYTKAIDNYAARFVSSYQSVYPEGGDDYRKVKFAYEYVISTTEYVKDSPNNQNILSVMLNGASVCQGYAKTTQYLLKLLGIEATMVVGMTSKDSYHAWNLVKADGEYYYVDSTWGDASYSMGTDAGLSAADLEALNQISYDYLLVNDNMIKTTHMPTDINLMPVCSSLNDNYYVREKLWFSSVDDAQIKAAFDRAYAEGRKYVTLKMSEASVYVNMKNYLLVDQNLFNYLQGDVTSVTYAESPDRLYMIFWL